MRLFRKARSRIVATGTVVTLIVLTAFALLAREAARRIIFDDLDEELETLSIAIASDLEARGAEEISHESLRSGIEANVLVYRLEHHSAVLFDGRGIVAASGDLARRARPDALAPFRHRAEAPFTAREPFTPQHRLCRFRVTHVAAPAMPGTTLLIFRPIDGVARTLDALELALAFLVIGGTTASALILLSSVGRALRPVEEITSFAERITARELSERVAVEAAGDEFHRLAAVINSLLGRLEEAFQVQRRFLSDAAHELKTPAAVIAAEAHELRRGTVTGADAERSLDVISRAVAGLAREVDDLLELARRDAAPLRVESFALHEAIAEALALAAPLARERGAQIVEDGDAEVQMLGDRAGVVRAVSNLVLNAIRYGPRDGEVRVEVRAIGDVCEIDVADRGPGIPSADRRRVFERFVRLPYARGRHPEGSGLGLAIVEQIVRAHGGSVEVLDREDGGSRFRLRLPIPSTTSPAC